MRRLFAIVTATLLAVALAACGAGQSGTQTGGITVRDPWVRATMMNMAGDQSGAMGNMQGGMQATPMAGMDDSHSHGNEYGNMAVSAAYMVLVNNGPADAIVKAESDVAKTVELHNVFMENNVMQMRQVEAIEVPANGQVELKPGSYHVMLIGLNRDLNEGDEVTIKLMTRSGKTIEVKAPVRKP
ncbi:MAG: hypothetical protein C0184_05750 [Chloroflexus aggregans]|uniref:Copper chaperone PCu(A)C n=1 Tax=Chloroflexus aggregans TaxID=152260 RepID=A0A2J6X7X1_9CHLR|nr:MAG: hypothetical protein C0184_05750 [Chloroflexus aggregans]